MFHTKIFFHFHATMQLFIWYCYQLFLLLGVIFLTIINYYQRGTILYYYYFYDLIVNLIVQMVLVGSKTFFISSLFLLNKFGRCWWRDGN